jgi:hypothetical protein
MPIPDASREDVLAAMERFDAEKRQTEYWRNWESWNNYYFTAIQNGQRYPVKQLVADTTGADLNSFNTTSAIMWLQRREFEIINIRESGQQGVNWWWANQGVNFAAEREGGFL